MRMTREMYESLQVKDLKGIAESRGLKSLSRLRKDALVERLLELDREEDEQVLREREEKAKEAEAARRAEQEQAKAAQKEKTAKSEEAGAGAPDAAKSAKAEETDAGVPEEGKPGAAVQEAEAVKPAAGVQEDPAAARQEKAAKAAETGAAAPEETAKTAETDAAAPEETAKSEESGTEVPGEAKAGQPGQAAEEGGTPKELSGDPRPAQESEPAAARNPAARREKAAAQKTQETSGQKPSAENGEEKPARSVRQNVVRRPKKKVEIAGSPQGRAGVPYASPYMAGRRERTAVPSASGEGSSRTPAPETAGGTSSGASSAPQSSSGAGRDGTAPATPAAQPSSSAPGQGGAPAPTPSTAERYARRGLSRPDQQIIHKNDINPELDSGEIAHGILEVMGDGFGFIRSDNYMPGENDVYVAPSQIRRFSLKTGDIVEGNIRIRSQNEKFSALLYVKSVNGMDPEETKKRFNFEDMTPIFPNERIRLEKPGTSIAMRVMDLMSPVGKGQRGMIVSPPKAGKTTLLKEVARSIKYNDPKIHLIILLIDERPEEVTDIREALEGPNVEVIHSTFDELPEHHKRVAEMTIERAKRLVEHRRDVVILLDSITRLTRAYNLTEPSSGRTLSGGLDPVALHMPKRFFGAARNMREGGSLTILATALIETGSKMDDVVYEEFKGTGNMELILNRKLSERRIFPAVDLVKSGTRRDDLLLTPDEQDCVATIRRAFIGSRGEEATDSVLELFARTRTNGEFVNMIKKHMWTF